jgi:hypothetical protein
LLRSFRATIALTLILSPTIDAFAKKKADTLYTTSEKTISARYMKYHKDFSKKLCTGKTDHVAEKLYKNFLGDGLYIPFRLDGSLDAETIQDHLPLIKKREKWIQDVLKKLSKKKSFKSELKSLRKLEKDFKFLLSYKYKYYKAKKFQDKKKVVAKSRLLVKKFLKDLNKFIYQIEYFHSYRFPVDHFYLRREYDKYKGIDTKEGKRAANRAYFLRKVVEEGAVDKDKGRSDLYLRALINTIYLRISSYKGSFLDEDLRYDLDSFFKNIESSLKRGKKPLVKRSKNWLSKTKKNYSYYSNLLKNSKTKSDILKKIYHDKSKARYALKNYIYLKESEVYKYWSNKPELYRKLFALETILIHEVGRLDNSYGSERRDVVRVVMNRIHNSNYNFIGKDEPLYKFLEKKKINTQKYPWLNVLFKQGEFSFTYFFIPASRGIFCPDQSRTAKRLRKKNLKIAMSVLKNSTHRFKATRYFSRASMLGRIDMAQLWYDYSPVEERPGPILKKSSKYLSLYKKNQLFFLYSFTAPNGNKYEVMRYKKTDVVYGRKEKKFFEYRNPHFFKYFVKNESYK